MVGCSVLVQQLLRKDAPLLDVELALGEHVLALRGLQSAQEPDHILDAARPIGDLLFQAVEPSSDTAAIKSGPSLRIFPTARVTG